MNQESVTVVNWFCLLLLLPATLILAWKLVTEKPRRKRISSHVITVALGLVPAIIGLAELNIDKSATWLGWALLLAQLIVLVLLYKRLWFPLMQRLRG
jgi:ABC-type molybdate transport system permease subunit